MKKALAIILLLSAGIFAQTGWKYGTTSTDGTKWYWLPSRTVRTKTTVRAWVKIVQPVSEENIERITTYDEIDCANKRNRTLQFTFYYRDGEINTELESGAWEYIQPDTSYEVVAAKICLESLDSRIDALPTRKKVVYN